MRNFGVEIEFISKRGINNMARYIEQETGIEITVAGYYDKSNKWRLKTDSSICGDSTYRHGMEFVTPILSTEQDLETLCKIVEVMERDSIVNRTCGVHVHTDITQCGPKPMRKLMKFLAKYEKAINKVLPKSRRGSENSYCRDSFGYDADLWAEFESFDRRKTTDTLMRKFGRGKWNFQNYVQHGTFENRAHGGTLNSTKIRNWVLLNQAIVNCCFDTFLTRIKTGDTCSTYTLKDMLAELVRKGYIDNPMKSYYLNREEDLR
jgi:hypothetical protein